MDRPIIFSAPMVRALLAGRKTQTRRLLNPQPETFMVDGAECKVEAVHVQGDAVPRVATGMCLTSQKVPYAKGDRLYVREAHHRTDDCDDSHLVGYDFADDFMFETEYHDVPGVGRVGLFAHSLGGWGGRSSRNFPSIHMPRWASRLTLLVDDVRVERLQAISEADAIAEGIEQVSTCGGGPMWKHYPDGSPAGGWLGAAESFRTLWQSLHGADSWAANPFVVAVTFSVARGNIDRLAPHPHPTALAKREG